MANLRFGVLVCLRYKRDGLEAEVSLFEKIIILNKWQPT